MTGYGYLSDLLDCYLLKMTGKLNFV